MEQQAVFGPKGETAVNTTAHVHPRTIGWVGTTALAMGGSNQSLFLIGALIVSQGSAAVPLLIVGLLLSWAAAFGWTELILMWPNRVGGIAATCAEAFRPYSPVLANLTGVCYWWGWVPTCGLTALLSATAISEWYLPSVPIPLLASALVLCFTIVNLWGVRWVTRLAVVFASVSAGLAFLSSLVPVLTGHVNWHQAVTFHLVVPFGGFFGGLTSAMAGLYLIGFAAPAFEAAACHVGETIDPARNVPRAMFASAAMATVYFAVLPVIWLGVLGANPLTGDLAQVLGPTFAPLLGTYARSAAIWFMMFNMFHGTLQPLAGASRTLMQLAEDGLLPRVLALRSRTDVPWVATLLTAAMAVAFLLTGDPPAIIAAANFTYLIGICLPNVAVWLLRRDAPRMARPYRAPRGTIALGLLASGIWGISTILGFEQFGLPIVLLGLAMAYSGSALYAWRRWSDRRRTGIAGLHNSLHLKLTGAMLIVLILDGGGYYLAVSSLSGTQTARIAALQDIFVVVAMLTISVGLVLPGMIGHSAAEVALGARRLATGALADLGRAMRALGAGDLDEAYAQVQVTPVVVHSRDELGEMAHSFNTMQEEVQGLARSMDWMRRQLSLQRAATALIGSTLQLDDVYHEFAACVRELVPLERLSITAIDTDAPPDANLLTVYAMGPGTSVLPIGARRPLATSRVGEACRTQQIFRAHDLGMVRPGDLMADERLLYSTGLRSGIIVPLIAQNTSIGSLNLWCNRPGVYTDQHLRPIIALAPLLAAALHNSRLFDNVQRTAQELRDREEAVYQAKRAAEQASYAKSVFLSRMSHELRTPLNAILGFGQLLQMDELEPDQDDSVAHIVRAGRHLLSLINEVLDISGIETGHVALTMESLSADAVIEDACQMVTPLAAERGIQVNTIPSQQSDGGSAHLGGLTVRADRQRLKQVLVNLLSNAIKYNVQDGSVTISCLIEEPLGAFREPGGRLRIRVTDTGIGIPANKIDRLFTPFDRLGAERTTIEGSGVGLSLTKSLVEAMDGAIGAESVAGQGSTFWVDLAVASDGEMAHVWTDDDDRAALDAAHLSCAIPATDQRYSILHIEDNILNMQLVQRLLAGYSAIQLITAQAGHEGLEFARRYHPNVILLDLHLPDLTGDEVVRQLHESALTRGIPVIIVTADTSGVKRARLLAAGVRDFLYKPLDRDRLFAALSQILPADEAFKTATVDPDVEEAAELLAPEGRPAISA